MDNFRSTHAPMASEQVFRCFGEKGGVLFRAKGQASYKVRGVFSALFWESDPGGMLFSSEKPTLFVALADFARPPKSLDDHFTIRGTEYQVTKVEPDDAGHALVQLQCTSWGDEGVRTV